MIADGMSTGNTINEILRIVKDVETLAEVGLSVGPSDVIQMQESVESAEAGEL